MTCPGFSRLSSTYKDIPLPLTEKVYPPTANKQDRSIAIIHAMLEGYIITEQMLNNYDPCQPHRIQPGFSIQQVGIIIVEKAMILNDR